MPHHKAKEAAAWLHKCAERGRNAGNRGERFALSDLDTINVAASARIIDELIELVLFQETEIMKVVAIAAAAEKKIDDLTGQLANVPPPPPPDRLLSDADVAGLTSLATKNGIDVDGNPLPSAPNPPPRRGRLFRAGGQAYRF
jgi:hypothetical protein